MESRNLPRLVCSKCGHKWIPRTEMPLKCPRCQNPLTGKGFLYEHLGAGINDLLDLLSEQVIGQQDFILYPYRRVRDFLLNHFQASWISKEEGIQMLSARLLDAPETIAPFALIFFRAKGWTPQLIDQWLADHPQYSPASLSPQPTGIGALAEGSQKKPKESVIVKQGKIQYRVDSRGKKGEKYGREALAESTKGT